MTFIKHQSRETGIIQCVDIGAGVNEHSNQDIVSCFDGKHERRLACITPRVDIGAALKENAHQVFAFIVYRPHKRR
jgi:hypothetical protein